MDSGVEASQIIILMTIFQGKADKTFIFSWDTSTKVRKSSWMEETWLWCLGNCAKHKTTHWKSGLGKTQWVSGESKMRNMHLSGDNTLIFKHIALTSSAISRNFTIPVGSRMLYFHQDQGAVSWINSSSVLDISAGVTCLLGLSSLYSTNVVPMADIAWSRGMTITHLSFSKCWQICTSAPAPLEISIRLGCGLISRMKTGWCFLSMI